MQLVTSKDTGVISFKTDPAGALIYLDGEEYGIKTPAAINNIPVGNHAYVLRREGFLDFQGKATVKDGALCCIEINMTTSKSEEKCSTEEVPTYEIPTPPKPTPDYGMLVLGLIIGLIIAGLYSQRK